MTSRPHTTNVTTGAARSKGSALPAHSAADAVRAEASRLFAEAVPDLGELGERVARLVAHTVGDACTVRLLSDDGTRLVLVAASAADPVLQAAVVAVAEGTQEVAEGVWEPVLRERRAISLVLEPGDVPETASPEQAAFLREHRPRAILGLPLEARGALIGGLSLVRYGGGPPFQPEEISLANDLAERAALAIDNARLLQAQIAAATRAEEARARTERLQGVTAALVGARTAQQVAAILLEQGLAVLGGSAGSVALCTAEGTELEILASTGYPASTVAGWQRFSVQAAIPLAETVRTGEPIWIAAPDELLERYPALAPARGDAAAWASLPLAVDGRLLGAIGLSFDQPRPFSPEDRAFMLALAGQCALALERTRLREAEQRAEQERALLLASEAAARAEARAEARYHALLEAAPDAIVTVNADGQIVATNSATERLFGYRPAELLGQPIELLVPDRLRGRHVAERRAYQADPHLRSMGSGLELNGRRKDGTEFPAEVSLSPAELDGELLVTAAVRDVTAKRELERQKDEFFSSVSHDLRTPLAAITASIGVVLANEPPGTPAAVHRMLVNIDEAADDMERLVEDLLELARVQTGRLELYRDQTDLREVALRVAREIEPLARARGQRVRLDLPAGPLEGWVDGDRLGRVLLNLLGNATKYGRERGSIRLTLEQLPGEALFSVTDDGEGIPEADRERIFERFYRAPTDATRATSGSGLGLAIARALVELHGGRIWVDSSAGRGATFRVALPLEPPDQRKDVTA